MIIFKKESLYPAMPCAARTKSGDILAVFRCAPREKRGYTHLHSLSTIMIARSGDDGKSWTDAAEAGSADLLAKQDPHLFIAEDGTILLYYFRYLFHPESELDALQQNSELVFLHAKRKKTIATLRGLGLMISSDNGTTFSAPRDIVLPGVVSCAVRGRVVQLPGGRILLATYARKQQNRYCIDIIGSDDQGDSWYMHTTNVAATRQRKGLTIEYVEPSLLLDGDGRLHLFLRTHEGEEKAYTSYCYSDDSGTSFTAVKQTSIRGFPLDPLPLADGRILLTYGWREDKPFGIHCRIVKPDLSDIDRADEVKLGRSSSSPDCGYPWSVQLDHENILVVYYRCDSKGVRSIEGEILSV